MSVVAEIKDVGPCRKQLSISVPPAAVAAEVQRVVETFRRHARAPGFRQGKMPESMVRQRHSQDIEKEVLDRLIPRYWKQAQAEESLQPMLPPQVEEVDFHPDDQLSFVATVEVRPEIALGELESFDLPDLDVEPGADEIDEALDRLRRDVGEWVVVDRSAGEGDLVEATVQQLNGADRVEPDEPQEVAFEVGHKQVWPELSDAVKGLSQGESAEFQRPPEDDDEGPTRRYDAAVKAVKELELPDLDDDLAKRLGSFESVEELRVEVSRSIAASKRAERRSRREGALLTELRDRHPMTLPEGVVEMEIEGLLREYAENLASRGVDVEKAELDWQELAGQIRPQAEERVQSRLLLDAVAESKQIEVGSEELEKALVDLSRAQQTSMAELRQAMSQSGQLEKLTMQLQRHKTLTMLLGEDDAEDHADLDRAGSADEG